MAAAVAAGAAVPGGSDDHPLYRKAASNISSSSAGRLGVHGALAGVQFPRYSLIAAGAPPRHVKALALPAGFLASNSKGGRLAAVVVAAVAASAPGESDDELPSSEDCEAALSAFQLEMELFKFSQRPVVALVGSPTDLLMEGASRTAKDCTQVLEFLLARVPVHRDTLKELISVGQVFLTVESQAKEGYVKADALASSIQGLKLVCKIFFEGVKFPEYSGPVVPHSADDINKESFFKELINVFIVLHTALYWEACNKYGFSTGGANYSV
ncbi:uncharacterized protein LOC110433120 [Sorghum bicolor]|nr:uncharacterized protein LOC110433120 [Sorghum bicolor]|eukprot:XP_021310470.1 uncharacterized protein LOC110433120 [Sorghum bicolor]